MIKANELRLGNKMFIPSTNQIVEISCINKYIGVYVNDGFSWLGFQEIKPIPLTEEILLKCGFVEIDTYDDHYYYLQKCDLGLDRSFQPYGIGFIPDLKHVHQLQNLYFALTNEELKIKEDEKV